MQEKLSQEILGFCEDDSKVVSQLEQIADHWYNFPRWLVFLGDPVIYANYYHDYVLGLLAWRVKYFSFKNNVPSQNLLTFSVLKGN